MILILCSPRTGSSIVSRIFHEHGCYIGKMDNRAEYPAYESKELKEVARKQWLDYNKNREKDWGIPMEPTETHLANVASVMQRYPENTCFKTIVEFYKLFLQFEPKIILINRNEDSAVKSMAHKHGKMSKAYMNGIREIHRKRMASMEQIEKDYGAKWIDTDKLIEGDYKMIRAAFRYCGMRFNKQIGESVIDPNMWNH